MGFLGGLLGSGSGAGFQARGTNILQPANAEQAQNAYSQVQSANGQNQNFYELLAGQNGAQNQSSVFNQLQGIANGTGANPAMAQLANSTGANVANQAALMAGQRGAGANAGLLARQAAMQGGNIQQQAAGQGAALQAQQQQQALAQLAGISGQQVAQSQQALQGLNQGAQNLYGTNLGAINAQNNANVSMQGNINSANAGIAQGNQKSQSDLFGGALNGLGSAAMLLNQGGTVPHYAEGGAVAPQSFAGNFFNSGQQPAAQASSIGSGMAGLIGGLQHLAGGQQQAPVAPLPGASMNDYANLGTGASANDYQQLPNAVPMAPQVMAPQIVAAPQLAMPAQNIAPGAMVAAQGGQVPGRAAVQGDSLKNDKVPAVLSPGEIVIPRSVLESSNPALAAAHFVEQEMAKHGKKMADGGMVQGGDSWADRWGKMAKGARKAFDNGGTAEEEDAVPVEEVSPEQAFYQQARSNGGPYNNPNIPQFAAPEMSGGASGDWGAPSPAPAPANQNIPSGSEVGASAPAAPLSSLESLKKAYGQQKAGIYGEQKAMSQQAKDEQAITGKAASDLEAQQSSAQGQIKDLDVERQKLLADVQNSHIDPNHYLGNMSTGSKVSTAIGLILGGMGGAVTHQENPALKYLQSQIDNDLKAQVSDMGKKQNLLTANMQQFGNLKDALAMTKANMLDIASMKMKEAAAKALDPIAKARGMQEAAKLDMQASSAIAPLKAQQEFTRAMQSGNVDPIDAIRMTVPEHEQSAAINDLKSYQDRNAVKQDLLGAFHTVEKNRDLFQAPSFRRAAQNAMNIGIAELSKDATGRFNLDENKKVEAQFKPGYFDNADAVKLRLSTMARALDAKNHYPRLQKIMPLLNRQSPSRFDQAGESKIKEGKPKV